ncbi:ABC transporter permease [Paenibacillus pseudetheri]|uniref:ABC transporter permease n=1 Tax=Paenibacillus pseudetheri TaxID=2897682 RepID=A0ABN8FR68_9BACL|nr:ABC-2 family transporter protein [Paenibacillus pseudetheri]CAH1058979.1 hypothetical protein PAECIP111894_05165 [Paenibacillus pseudetheri]
MKKYLLSFNMGIQNAIEYRFNFFLSLISIVFPIIIQTSIWIAAFNHSSESTLYGYNFTQMLLYTLLAALISRLVATGIEYEINEDIKNGGLNKYIIRPINYFMYKLSVFIGSKCLQYIVLSILIVIIVSGASFYTDEYELGVHKILVSVFILISSCILNFLISYIISAIAFWLTDVSYLFVVTTLLVNIVSGGIFPLEIFGNTVNRIFDFLPFKYTIYFPVNTLNGNLSGAAITSSLFIQWMWILVIYLLAKLVWRRAMTRYIAVGG